jgi:hypothetical protein
MLKHKIAVSISMLGLLLVCIGCATHFINDELGVILTNIGWAITLIGISIQLILFIWFIYEDW